MTKAQARHLRRTMTEGERKLWQLLRRKQLAGFRFRRQAPIGPYIADFFCAQSKLIVELDGAPHTEEERAHRDIARTAWLETHGCRVLRLWNIDVFNHPTEVTEAIYQALTRPPPNSTLSSEPSPLVGEGVGALRSSARPTEGGPRRHQTEAL